MEILKNYGKIGLIIAAVAFLLVFIQNSFNSDIIKDSINYNLIYSLELNGYNGKEQFIILNLKNNGIKSIDTVIIDIKSRTNKINDIILLDTINFSIKTKSGAVLKNISISNYEALYPRKRLELLLKLQATENIKMSDFNLYVNSKMTNGISVDNVIGEDSINFQNLKRHIKGTSITIVYILLYVLAPTAFFLFVIVFLYKCLERNHLKNSLNL